jgi:DNA-binding transcriptional ArsR family regulator
LTSLADIRERDADRDESAVLSLLQGGGVAARDFDVPAGRGAAKQLDLALVLHALSDPVRLGIVAQLADGAEHACGDLEVPVTKSTSSHHFRVLREAGVITTRAEGKARLNRLCHAELEQQFPGLIEAVLEAAARTA